MSCFNLSSCKCRRPIRALSVSGAIVIIGCLLTPSSVLVGQQLNGARSEEWVDDLSSIIAADWNYQTAAHLFDRGGFCATPEEI